MRKKLVVGSLLVLMLFPALVRAQPATEITMMTWGGAFLDAFKGAADEFQKQTGVRVVFVTQVGAVDGYNKLKAQKASPQVDVLSTIESIAQLAAADGMVLPLDAGRIPALKELPANFVDPASVGVWVSPRGIFYRKDLVPFEIRSWTDLWDQRLNGRVGVSVNLDNASFLVMSALINGGSEKAIEPGFARVTALKPNVAAVYKTDLEAIRLLQTGEIAVAGWGTLSNVYKLLGPESNYRFVVPAGPQFFPSMRLVIIKGRRPEQSAAAEKFVNLLLSPEIQSKMTAAIATIPVHPKAQRPAALRSLIPEKITPYQINWTVVNEGYQEWLSRWARVLQ
jgi:putative spermidine/putrescine transport system substrate-binding protein